MPATITHLLRRSIPVLDMPDSSDEEGGIPEGLSNAHELLHNLELALRAKGEEA